MFGQLAGILVPVYGIVLVGYLYARRHGPDLSAANRVNLEVFTPALIFDVVSAKDFHLAAYQALALAGILVVLGSGLIGWVASRRLGIAPRTLIPPIMFVNSGNMGLPLAVLAFGPGALAAAVVLFLVENLLHFTVGVRLLDHKKPPLALLHEPLVLACLVGLGVSLSGLYPPAPVAEAVRLLGQVAIPLMLFALGARLTDLDLGRWRLGLLGALLRPASGLAVALPLLWWLPLPGDQPALLVLFALLPPAVLNYILAERYGQEPALVAAIVLWGNLASLLIIPVGLVVLFGGPGAPG